MALRRRVRGEPPAGDQWKRVLDAVLRVSSIASSSRPLSSSVVVPLRVQGRSIGVLNLAMGQGSSPFTEEDLRIAQMFAEQAGTLIDMTTLRERAEKRSSDHMALVESSRGLIGALDV